MISNINSLNVMGWGSGGPLAAKDAAGETASQDGGFGGELVNADNGLVDNLEGLQETSQAVPTQVAPKGSKNLKGQQPEEAYVLAGALGQNPMQAQVSVQPLAAQGAKSEATSSGGLAGKMAGVAESPALNPKTIGGSTAAAGFAGLKPWSKDWVFDTKTLANPELKTLLGSSEDKMIPVQAPQDKPVMPDAFGGSGGDAVSPEVAQLIQLAQLQQTMENTQPEGPQGLQGLKEMKGLIEGLSLANAASGVNGTGKNLNSISAKASNRAITPDGASVSGANGGLSGADFLSTLGAVRPVVKNDQGQQEEQGFQAGTGERKPEIGQLTGSKRAQRPLFESEGAQLRGFDGAAVQPTAANSMTPGRAPALEVAGHVAPGAMAQDRLTSESLIGLSTGIRSLNAQGGGEIRVRLKPENLGELHLRVVTRGNDVGLQIQANSEKAKEILEASVNHLKENLATQNLNLGRVELSVANVSHSPGSEMRNDHAGYQAATQNFGQNANQSGNGRSQNWREANETPVMKQTPAPSAGIRTAFQSSGRAVNAQGRLDVTA